MDSPHLKMPPKFIVGFRGVHGSVGNLLYLSQGSYIESDGDNYCIRGEKTGDRSGPIIAVVPTECVAFVALADAYMDILGTVQDVVGVQELLNDGTGGSPDPSFGPLG
jgi:hypothetical protein